MPRTVSCLLLLALVSGCNTMTSHAPKCDGYAKRPLNRSMWQWEAGKQRAAKPLGYFREERVPGAFEAFDERASYRKCAKALASQ
jgi:type IV secretion system protein VirB7